MTQFATGLPLSRGMQVKVASVARTDTTAKNLFVLPKGAVPLMFYLFTSTASDAGTTAVVSVGKTGSNTYFVDTADVKTAAGLLFPAAAKNTNLCKGLLADTQIVGIYAETGGASTTGGPFYIVCVYEQTGPGDITSAGTLVN